MFDDPVPQRLGEPGCLAVVRRGHGQWTGCTGEPVWAGWQRVDRWAPADRRGWWRGYACDTHRGLLARARVVTAEDVEDMEWRREQQHLALAGRPYERAQPVRP